MVALISDPETTESTLRRVTQQVLERYATVFSEPADDLIAYSSGQCLLGRTCLHGGMSGILSVAAPIGLCLAMVSSICGEDEQVGGFDLPAFTSSALAELANMIAGHVALNMDPHEHVWLTPAVVENSSFDDWVVMGNAKGTVRLNVEGWPLLASLAIS